MSASTDTPIVLAFSGGLDTSFCIPWLKETYGRPVVTVTVDTGGLDAAAAAQLEERAHALGAVEHRLIEARAEFFDNVLKYLIMGNVRRGHMYPLCVGAERGVQAKHLAELALELGADTVAHGCTAAGNDQVRFEIVLQALAPQLQVFAPVRDHAWARANQVKFLEERGLPVPLKGSAYSINRGLWGVTIGGTETNDTRGSSRNPPGCLRAARSTSRARREVELGFERGVPVSIDGERLDPVALIEQLETLAAPYGDRPRHPPRRHHLRPQRPRRVRGARGGRAHPRAPRAREAHADGAAAAAQGDRAPSYGDWVHEGQYLEPVCRDVEALLTSSQERVTGEVRCRMRPGFDLRRRRSSPHSLKAASRGIRRGRGRMDARRRARVLAPPGAARHVPYARAKGRRFVRLRRQDRLGRANGGSRARSACPPTSRARKGRDRGRRAHVEEHLQPARAPVRPVLADQAGRRHRRRARPPQGAVRVLGSPSDDARARATRSTS